MSMRKGSSRASSKSKDTYEDKVYHIARKRTIIYYAQLQNDLLLLVIKGTILLYDINTMKNQIASLLPESSCMVYVDSMDQKRDRLNVYDYGLKEVVGWVRVDFDVASLRARKSCIALAGRDSLTVLHFPTLKPIFHEQAGNGFELVFDISREGLTLVHSTHRQGEALIRNFTKIEANKLIGQIRTYSRRHTLNQRLLTGSVASADFKAQEEQQVKRQIYVAAHESHIQVIRMSPNGFRFVTCGYRGTVIRLFSSLNGNLMASYSMGTTPANPRDIDFLPNGTAITCLNQLDQVNFYHTCRTESQLWGETTKRENEQIYEQQNPTYFFSFLSFLHESLGYQLPFCDFNFKEKEEQDKKAKPLKQKTKKQQKQPLTPSEIKEEPTVTITEIKEEPQDESSDIKASEQGSFYEESPTSELKIADMSSGDIQLEEITLQPRKIESSMPLRQRRVSNRLSNQNRKSDGSPERQHRSSSLRSIGMLSKKQAGQVVNVEKGQMEIITPHILHFESITGLYVMREAKLWELSFDMFNGGPMKVRQSIDLASHPLFRDLH